MDKVAVGSEEIKTGDESKSGNGEEKDSGVRGDGAEQKREEQESATWEELEANYPLINS